MTRPWWVYLVWTVVVGYLLSGAVGGSFPVYAAHGWGGVVLNGVLHVCAFAAAFATLRREGTTGNTLLLGFAAGAGLISHGLAEFAGTGLLFLVAWLAPFRCRLWQAVLLAVLATGGFILVSLWLAAPASAIFGIAAGLGWAVFLAAIVHQLAVTKRQTAAVAAARAGEAVLAERQRMAREIHDLLAHALSAQVVHLEGTRLLLERGEDPALALDRVIRAGELARAGLEETKRAVAALRGDEGPLAEQLDGLAAEFRAVTGNPCAVEVSGDTDGLAPQARLAVVRTAQEALTNVHKHAPGAAVTITLRGTGDHCELDVRDTGGEPGDLAATGSGYGLIGMRERAELIGGTLAAGPDGQGFRVLLRMPS
jgi:signal transduction histidine kinase